MANFDEGKANIDPTTGIEARLRDAISHAWDETGFDFRLIVRPRDDGKLDITVISSTFEGLDSFEREALFWPVIRTLPPDDFVRMTYALLITPDESEHYFAENGR